MQYWQAVIRLFSMTRLLLFLFSATVVIGGEGVWTFQDVTGVRHQPLKQDGFKAMVVVFISMDCPIANAFQPELRRLSTTWSKQGVPFFLVHPDPDTGAEEVIVELNPLIESELGLRTGGTYSVVVDPNGTQVYVVLNAGEPSSGETFGEVVLAIVTLP